MSKPAGPFPRPDATAPGDNEWWENCVPKNTWLRPKARTRDATSSGSEGSADPAGFRRGGGGLHLPAPARGLRVRGGGRRQDVGLKPTYLRRRGCGPMSCFMPLSSVPVDARPSMCLRCFERNEFHVSLSQTSPIGGAFTPGSQAQPPSPWTVARPRRLAPQPRGRRDLPPLASPASAGPRPVSRVPRPAWVGGIGERGRETVTKPHGETQVKGRPRRG